MSQVDMDRTENDRTKRRFTEYARMQMAGVAFLSHQQQGALVKDGLSDFDLSLEECLGCITAAVERSETMLSSEIERLVRRHVKEHARGGRLSKRHFNKGAKLYRELSRASVTVPEARKRIKSMMIAEAIRPKRGGVLFIPLPLSRRWYDKV